MPDWDTTDQYHRYRLKDPGLFSEMRTKEITSGIKGVYGKLKSSSEWTWQNLMFDVDKFTLSEAKKWYSEHKDKFASYNADNETIITVSSFTPIGLQWTTPVKIKDIKVSDVFPGFKTVNAHGVVIDDSVNRNNWQIENDDLDAVVNQLIGKQIRINHSKNYEDVKGLITGAKRIDRTVEADMEITADANVLVPLIKEYARGLSVEARAHKILCSECRSEYAKGAYLSRTCKCVSGHEIIKDFEINEVSLVSEPAYGNTTFAEAIGFAASVNKILTERKNIEIKTKKGGDILTEENKSEPVQKNNVAEMDEIKASIKQLTESVLAIAKQTSEIKAEMDKKKEPIPIKASEIPKTDGAPIVVAEQPKAPVDVKAMATKEIFDYFAKRGVIPNVGLENVLRGG